MIVCFCLLISTCEAFAQNAIRRCSANQKHCYVFNKRLVTGDKVSIINEKNQLVAIGEISDMRETVRKITILKKYAPITTKCKVSRLTDQEARNPDEYFDMIKPVPSNYIYGSINLGSLRVGQGSTAFGGEGGYDWSMKNGFTYGAKGTFYYASGEASLYNAGGDEKVKTDFKTFGVLVEGVGTYRTAESRMLSFRVDLELGLGYLSLNKGEINEDDEVEGFGDYDSGVGLVFGAGGYAIYNSKGSIKPYVGAAMSYIKSKRYIRIGLGFSLYSY